MRKMRKIGTNYKFLAVDDLVFWLVVELLCDGLIDVIDLCWIAFELYLNELN